MAAKRMSNVFSYSEDTSCSEFEISANRNILSGNKRVRQQSSVRARNSKVRRLQHMLSSCDENVRVNRENYAHDGADTRYKKQACNSRNAVLARENRLKKKLYLDGLEGQMTSLKTENRKMKITLGTQSSYITDLESELNYLRNVLANSKEIGMLVKAVHFNTGLPVGSSLHDDKSSGRRELNIPTRKFPSARKTAWPYENISGRVTPDNGYIPTPPTSISSTSPAYEGTDSPLSPFNIDVTSCFSDDDLPIALNDVALASHLSVDEIMSQPLPVIEELSENNNTENAFMDHTYSSKLSTEVAGPSNFGVCLHISNKRVSLEFCSKCNSDAIANWDSVTC